MVRKVGQEEYSFPVHFCVMENTKNTRRILCIFHDIKTVSMKETYRKDAGKMEKGTSTIAAVATAMSPSGISIIRVSGPRAWEIADEVFRTPGGKQTLLSKKSHTIHYGMIYDDGEMIDEVLVMLMRGPKTFTAEDTVEIDCHGGVLVTKKVLEAVLRHGAEPAQPGEFTKRAFLNGRMDLSEAEAVMDVIHAKNNFALKASMNQLKGAVTAKIRELRSRILDAIAFIEAALDDPEHISMEGYADTLSAQLGPMERELGRLIDRAENGKLLSEGIRTVILGKPNAGKSSLLNVMTGQERAIVTDIAGTTRDVLEEQIRIGDMGVSIVDTAGIRETEDVVEQIGVKRAMEEAREADLILYVADSSRPLDENDREIISFIRGKRAIILLNKSDLTPCVGAEELKQAGAAQPILSVSAAKEDGMEELEHLLREMFLNGDISFNDEVLITNIRHKQCMELAKKSLSMVQKSIDEGMPEDFFTIDLMEAYAQLGYILGEEVEEDLVNRIFEKFCMGK